MKYLNAKYPSLSCRHRAVFNKAEINMLAEVHFPYALFLEGSNFVTQNITIHRPDGRTVTLDYTSGTLNRLDRLTAANYGMPLNTNLCKNRFISHADKVIMLQAASIYTHGDGGKWTEQEMSAVMSKIADTSLKILAGDLFTQLAKR